MAGAFFESDLAPTDPADFNLSPALAIVMKSSKAAGLQGWTLASVVLACVFAVILITFYCHRRLIKQKLLKKNSFTVMV